MENLKSFARHLANHTEIVLSNLSESDLREIIEELQTYQIELNLQNDELRNSRLEIENSKTRYFNLFDLAPIGYCVLDKKAVIRELNIKASEIFDRRKDFLIHRPFISLIEPSLISMFFENFEYAQNKMLHKKFEIWFNKNGQQVFLEAGINHFIDDLYLLSLSDISLQKTHAQQIQTEREQFLSLLNDIPEPIYVADFENSEILFANCAKKKLFGDDILGTKCYKTIHQYNEPCTHCLKSQLAKSENQTLRWEHYDPKINKHFYHVERLIRWHDGRMAKFQISFDLSELKNAEQQVRKLSVAVEQNPATIVITDTEGNIEYANPKFTELTGYTLEEAKGKNPRALKSGKTDPQVFINMWETIKSGKVWHGEFINRKKNNEEFIESATISPIFDDDKNIINFIAIKEDVTLKKIQEERIKLNNERLQHLLALAQMQDADMAMILDKALDIALLLTKSTHGYIYHYNEDNKRFTLNSWSKDTMSDCTIVEQQTTYDLDKTGIWGEVIRQRKAIVLNDFKQSNPLKKGYPEGHVEIFRFLSIPVFEGEEIIAVIGVCNKPSDYDEMDIVQLNLLANSVWSISRQKTDEQKLRQYAMELQGLNATKDKFFNIIAHDLKNPFNSILGFTNLLVKNFEHYSKEKSLQFLNTVHNTAKNTYKLVEDLLQWARAQSGKIDFKPEFLNLQYLFDCTVEITAQAARNKEIEVRAISRIPSEIFADKNMIDTVLRNLTSNAIKYTKRNGFISIESDLTDGFVQIMVKDNGVGIPLNELNKLFKLNEKVSSPGTEKEHGTGLGLLLCKEFVLRHGGNIWAESELGKGSTFYFTIPFAS